MQIIKERGAQNEISRLARKKNKQTLLEAGGKGKEMVLQQGRLQCSKRKQKKNKKTPPWRWKHLLIQNNSSLQTINCIHQNH